MKTLFCDVTTVSEEEFKLWFSMMSEERKERCRRLRTANAQKCCIAADRLIRNAAEEALKIAPKDLIISIADSGKPFIKGNPIYFSVSHTDIMVVCAYSDAPVGIDIELNRPVLVSAQERICTPEEWEYLNVPKSDAERSLRFFEIWTRKEAIFKLDGILPRKDKEIPTLHPESLGIRVKTTKAGKYTLSEAEFIL